MDKNNYHDNWYLRWESNIKDSVDNSRVSTFIGYAHSFYTFYLIAGFCQVFLGISVVTISILGLIRPLWLSTFLSMGASITTMIGLYLVYITVSKSYDRNSLLRSAMKRVMESKN
jgi:hypothetical protein